MQSSVKLWGEEREERASADLGGCGGVDGGGLCAEALVGLIGGEVEVSEGARGGGYCEGQGEWRGV